MIMLEPKSVSGRIQREIHAGLPLPFHQVYADFLAATARGTLSIMCSESPCAVMPVTINQSAFFKTARIEYPPLLNGERLGEDEERAFLDSFVSYARTQGLCHRIIPPPNHCLFKAVPDGARSCQFGTYRLSLGERTVDDILAGMHPNHRRQIRQAQKQGIRIKEGPALLELFYSLHLATMTAAGLGTDSLEFIRGIYRCLQSTGGAYCAVAFDSKQTPLGSLFVPYNQAEGLFLYGGSSKDTPASGAIKLLHWDAINHLHTKGVRSYNFVGARLRDVSGTTFEDIQRFKSRFGSALEKGYLWKMDIARGLPLIHDTFRRVRAGLLNRPMTTDLIDQESTWSLKKSNRSHP